MGLMLFDGAKETSTKVMTTTTMVKTSSIDDEGGKQDHPTLL
jgi:hypothetical protein